MVTALGCPYFLAFVKSLLLMLSAPKSSALAEARCGVVAMVLFGRYWTYSNRAILCHRHKLIVPVLVRIGYGRGKGNDCLPVSGSDSNCKVISASLSLSAVGNFPRSFQNDGGVYSASRRGSVHVLRGGGLSYIIEFLFQSNLNTDLLKV